MFGVAMAYYGTTLLLLLAWTFWLWEERLKLAAACCAAISLLGAMTVGYTAWLWL